MTNGNREVPKGKRICSVWLVHSVISTHSIHFHSLPFSTPFWFTPSKRYPLLRQGEIPWIPEASEQLNKTKCPTTTTKMVHNKFHTHRNGHRFLSNLVVVVHCERIGAPGFGGGGRRIIRYLMSRYLDQINMIIIYESTPWTPPLPRQCAFRSTNPK